MRDIFSTTFSNAFLRRDAIVETETETNDVRLVATVGKMFFCFSFREKSVSTRDFSDYPVAMVVTVVAAINNGNSVDYRHTAATMNTPECVEHRHFG